jgi:hypothetical protein
MALGALIGAYAEDETGGLRALLPLAGRTLVEYQARCAHAAGAAPIVVLVERLPASLKDALERLRADGVAVLPVSDGAEAASRFEPGERLLLIGDGVAPPPSLLSELVKEAEPVIVTVPDDPDHHRFERIDSVSRWAGVALVDGQMLGATAAMLGDWDLQSTLLRKALQGGALLLPIAPDAPQPLIADTPQELAGFERGLLTATRAERTDAASRFLLPMVEDLLTEWLMERPVRPAWLLSGALALSLAATIAFLAGWRATALILLLLSTPLDLVAARLASLRLAPLGARDAARRLLWPAAGLALLALGWWQARHGGGWGALFAALTAIAFAFAAQVERGARDLPGKFWLFSRRNAIFVAVPFALAGAWTSMLPVLAGYAAASFFFCQHVRHRVHVD